MHLPVYDGALEQALSIVPSIMERETVDLASVTRRVLAHDIVADRDLPPFNRSQMDGYGVVACDIQRGVSLEVVGSIAAGAKGEIETSPGTCVAIATGAPVPPQFDAVVQHEWTDRGDLEGSQVTFNVDEVKVGNAIHSKGADATSGTVLIKAGTTITAQHIGIAATVGTVELEVVREPRIVILTSGDEVVVPDQTPEAHQIRNSNSTMVASIFKSFGCCIISNRHLHDDVETTIKEVEKAVSTCDLLITVGGISVGDRDFFPDAFAAANVEFAVQGASIQPGKPIVVGKSKGTMVLGLPGNPVSALVCSYLFGLPIVRTMLGISEPCSWIHLPLASSVMPNKRRTAFRPCNIVEGNIVIEPWQGSGDLSHTAQTVGLARLPMLDSEIPAGELVPFLRF
jgi:molybdopterin molybdotransferase